ncbi:cytochrome P450 [Mucidula mucida]|nr:cytochrome P450 [Mucidula mucida]
MHYTRSLAMYIAYKIVHRLFLYPYLLSPLRSVPGPPLGNPFLGQASKLSAEDSGEYQREWIKEHGSIIRVVGPIGMERLMFLSPEALQQILVKGWLDYPRPRYLRKILGMVTGYGLLTVTGDEHRQMRKAMNPAFSITNLTAQTDMYYEPIEGLIEVLTSEIKAQDSQEIASSQVMMYEWLSKVTLDIICETAFGYRTDSLHNPHNELAEAYEHLLSLQSSSNMGKLILCMSIPGGPRFLASEWAYEHRSWFRLLSTFAPLETLLDSMHTIRRISAQMLAEKIRETSGITIDDMHTKKDIMSLLVRARQADLTKDGAYSMTDEAMVDQVLTFLGAGHETTASGLSWTLWLLANNAEVQQRLRDEVTPVLENNPRPDYRTLKEMQYLDCVIMEGLRVMPPVPITTRKAARTDYIEGVLVPKGTLLHICIRSINTWEAIWGDDAEEFRPERWRDLPKAYDPAFSFLPFIAGPHACIGKTMAIVEMKAILAALIANFEFRPTYEGQVAKPAAAITMRLPTSPDNECLHLLLYISTNRPLRDLRHDVTIALLVLHVLVRAKVGPEYFSHSDQEKISRYESKAVR